MRLCCDFFAGEITTIEILFTWFQEIFIVVLAMHKQQEQNLFGVKWMHFCGVVVALRWRRNNSCSKLFFPPKRNICIESAKAGKNVSIHLHNNMQRKDFECGNGIAVQCTTYIAAGHILQSSLIPLPLQSFVCDTGTNILTKPNMYLWCDLMEGT